MSVIKDASGRRYIQVEVEVPGTPEEVWQAIATGPGVTAWFVPTDIRDDGTVVSRFGPGMDAVAKRTAWDPPRRFAAESKEWLGPNTPSMATEWIIEARAGGTCLVRVVHSLFAATDEWDDQLESVESGWPGFFRILRLYLTYFKGERCSPVHVMGMSAEPAEKIWERVTNSLGLSSASGGQRCRTSAPAPRLAGLIERVGDDHHPHQLLIRLDEPTPGIAHVFALPMGAQMCVAMRLYLYGDGAAAAAARDEPQWQAWMNERLGSVGDASKAG
jgi:uncharacterized protein YndB with AHSA1/START domain